MKPGRRAAPDTNAPGGSEVSDKPLEALSSRPVHPLKPAEGIEKMKLLSAAQTRALDQATIQAQQISSVALMERAADAVTNWLLDELLPDYDTAIHVCCGPGNNGGDGLAVARNLHRAGYPVQLWLLPAARHSADFSHQKKQLPTGLVGQELDPDKLPDIPATAVVVDALFGTGLSRPLEGTAAALVRHLNDSSATVVAIDMPSGLFGDTPQPADSLEVHAKVLDGAHRRGADPWIMISRCTICPKRQPVGPQKSRTLPSQRSLPPPPARRCSVTRSTNVTMDAQPLSGSWNSVVRQQGDEA